MGCWLALLPQIEQTRLRQIERIGSIRLGQAGGREDGFEAVPKGLRGEAVSGEMPESGQSGAFIPVLHFGFGAGFADAVNGGEQDVVSGGRAGTGFMPKRLEKIEDAGLFGGEPKGTGEAELACGGSNGDGSGAVFDEGGDSLSGAQVVLMNDAWLAVDAGAFDGVVVSLLALLFGDDGRNRG